MTTTTAAELIDLSQREDRTVTEYPDTQAEWDAINEGLLAECEDSVDVSGDGHNEPESNGYTDYWGQDWRVHLVNPEPSR